MIETLETRRLFSASAFASSEEPNVMIHGTDKNGTVTISEDDTRLFVKLNGKTQTFQKDAVKSLTLFCRGGHDVVTAEGTVETPLLVFGGKGADRLTGGQGDDQLCGGDGMDTINGSGGDDIIFGGSSNDTVDGGMGNDMLCGGHDNDKLNGQDGNDRLCGKKGNDVLTDTTGTDAFYGGNGDDTLHNGFEFGTGDGDADLFDGGAGYDGYEGQETGTILRHVEKDLEE